MGLLTPPPAEDWGDPSASARVDDEDNGNVDIPCDDDNGLEEDNGFDNDNLRAWGGGGEIEFLEGSDDDDESLWVNDWEVKEGREEVEEVWKEDEGGRVGAGDREGREAEEMASKHVCSVSGSIASTLTWIWNYQIQKS